MESDEYEWDDAKAEANWRKHNVSFEEAVEACEDPFAFLHLDDGDDYGEDRTILVGSSSAGLLTVVFTDRGNRRRIISAREASRYERKRYNRAAQGK